MNYIISQNRYNLDVAHISDSIKQELLSDWDSAYHKILAVMSKVFDENEHIENLDIIFTIKDTITTNCATKYHLKELVIKSAIINNDHFSNVQSHFERNGFKYETL